MLSIWPISERSRGSVTGLIISIIIYAVVAAVLPIVLGLFLKVGGPVGWVLSIIMWCINLYCAIGIVVSILVFLGIVKS